MLAFEKAVPDDCRALAMDRCGCDLKPDLSNLSKCNSNHFQCAIFSSNSVRHSPARISPETWWREAKSCTYSWGDFAGFKEESWRERSSEEKANACHLSLRLSVDHDQQIPKSNNAKDDKNVKLIPVLDFLLVRWKKTVKKTFTTTTCGPVQTNQQSLQMTVSWTSRLKKSSNDTPNSRLRRRKKLPRSPALTALESTSRKIFGTFSAALRGTRETWRSSKTSLQVDLDRFLTKPNPKFQTHATI